MSIDNATPAEWNELRDKLASVEVRQPEADNVNHPAHYNNGNIECIDYLEDNLGRISSLP